MSLPLAGVGDRELKSALADLARFMRAPFEDVGGREAAEFAVKGLVGLNGLPLFFKSAMSCFNVSRVLLSPGNFESIA